MQSVLVSAIQSQLFSGHFSLLTHKAVISGKEFDKSMYHILQDVNS